MTDWHEQDEFWDAFGGAMFDAAAWEAATEQVAQIETLLALEPGGRVLDLCCGPGRHTLELARRGYRVTGVDRTRHFLDACAERAAEEGLDVELVEEDMRAFRRPDSFDVAINLLTSFGYFRDPADDRRVTANLFDSVVPGGRFVIDMMGKENLARIFQARDWRELDGEFFLYERRIEDGWSWIENRWVRISGAERQEYTVGHRLYAGTELMRLFEDAGFVEVEALGDLDGRPYDTEAKRLVVTGRKPAAER